MASSSSSSSSPIVTTWTQANRSREKKKADATVALNQLDSWSNLLTLSLFSIFLFSSYPFDFDVNRRIQSNEIFEKNDVFVLKLEK